MDDFKFDEELNIFFCSTEGVGSKITAADEASKRQLTVSRHERELLLRHHSNLPVGSLKAAEARGEQTKFRFRKFPTGQLIELKLNFPKKGKNELRLYFNEEAFSPNANENWFLYERSGEIWIGTLDDTELAAARIGTPIDPQNGFDQAAEEAYQEALNAGRPELVLSTHLKYRRDPSIAINALSKSGFKCEILPAHDVFTSRVTGKPYLEAHHLVPMMEQRHFESSLDVADNICILNPYVHKMLHHATYSEISPLLKTVIEPRESFLKHIGVSIDRVLRSYGGP